MSDTTIPELLDRIHEMSGGSTYAVDLFELLRLLAAKVAALEQRQDAAWIEATERMPQEPDDFPCWGYWGKAAHSQDYDCRGPSIMREMFNKTLTHWMPIDSTKPTPPAPAEPPPKQQALDDIIGQVKELIRSIAGAPSDSNWRENFEIQARGILGMLHRQARIEPAASGGPKREDAIDQSL